MKRLVAFTESPDFVCYRYRLEAFRWALAARGWHLEVVSRDDSPAGFVRQMVALARADAVVLQRKLLCWWQRRLLRRAAKVLLYDFDDAVFLRDSNSPKPAKDGRRRRRFEQIVRAADACFAGNEYLRQQADARAVQTPLHVLPTCVEPALYTMAAHERRDGSAQLVWIGSHTTMPSLHGIHESIAAATAQLPGLSLNVVCDVFPDLSGVNIVPKTWSAQTEVQELATADIGVAWMPDHPWSLGKCGLKVLQYMAAGLPVVANPFGIHRELVVHGETGFLARSREQWVNAIATLAHSPELRRRMGAAGRARVVERFSVQRWGAQLAAIVDETAASIQHPLLSEARAA